MKALLTIVLATIILSALACTTSELPPKGTSYCYKSRIILEKSDDSIVSYGDDKPFLEDGLWDLGNVWFGWDGESPHQSVNYDQNAHLRVSQALVERVEIEQACQPEVGGGQTPTSTATVTPTPR